jgi:phenylacetate-CoA ligase
MAIWDERHECMSREDLKQIQLEGLQATINRAYKNVAHYRKKFKELGIVPEDIRALAELRSLSFTTIDDLNANYPYGMFAVPLREVVRIHTSSGVSARPVVVGYTKNDIRTWSNLVARVMTSAGVNHDDKVQIALSYNLLTGAFGLHYGAETIGASVIPAGPGRTEKQIIIMQDYKTTVLVSTPNYAITVAERIEQMGIDARSLSLRLGLFGAEPLTDKMRAEIESRLGISATDNYGLSAIIGPGVAGECACKCGMHISEDAFIPEIIDPVTGSPLPAGVVGELVLTTLSKEAHPIIRYRTGDMTSLDYAPCACGRTMVRMKKIVGRSDDMIIIKGINVYPVQVGALLLDIIGSEVQYQIVADRKGSTDLLEIKIEATENIFFDKMTKQKAFLEMIMKKLESIIGVSLTVKLVAPNTLPRKNGKAVKIIDLR